MTDAPPSNDRHDAHSANHDLPVSPKRLARLAAIQAFFQVEASGASASEVIEQFILGQFHHILDGEPVGQPDVELFRGLVEGSCRYQQDAQSMLDHALREGWQIERIDPVARAMIIVAIYEILHAPLTPIRVILSEYSAIAYAFFDDDHKEPVFVSGVLNVLSRQLRPHEFEPS